AMEEKRDAAAEQRVPAWAACSAMAVHSHSPDRLNLGATWSCIRLLPAAIWAGDAPGAGAQIAAPKRPREERNCMSRSITHALQPNGEPRCRALPMPRSCAYIFGSCQLISGFPAVRSAALIWEKGLLPKNPVRAESGEGCADCTMTWRLVSTSGTFFCA